MRTLIEEDLNTIIDGPSLCVRAGVFPVKLYYRNCIRILTYHGVEPTPHPIINYDGLHVPKSLFEQHMHHLKKHFHVISLEDAVQTITHHRKAERHSVVITFDDGYLNNFTHAIPVLQSLNLPATFFLATNFIRNQTIPWWYQIRTYIAQHSGGTIPLPNGNAYRISTDLERINCINAIESLLLRQGHKQQQSYIKKLLTNTEIPEVYPFMTSDHVNQMISMGFDIGLHSANHASCKYEATSSSAESIQENAEALRKITGIVPHFFAYPFGHTYSSPNDATRVFNQAGITCALTCVTKFNRIMDNPYTLGRWNITSRHSINRFCALVSGLQQAYYQVQERLSRIGL